MDVLSHLVVFHVMELFEVLRDKVASFMSLYQEQTNMEKLLAAPQQAMRLTKRAVVQGEQSSLRASLDLISSFMGIVTELDDYRQRTSALVAKMQRKAQ